MHTFGITCSTWPNQGNTTLTILSKFPGWVLRSFSPRHWNLACRNLNLCSKASAGMIKPWSSCQHQYPNKRDLHIQAQVFPFVVVVWQPEPRKDFVNPIALTVGFNPRNISFCLMHCLHLGIAHFCNGGALLCLLSFNFFGSFAYMFRNSFGMFWEFVFLKANHWWQRDKYCCITLLPLKVQPLWNCPSSWMRWRRGSASGSWLMESSIWFWSIAVLYLVILIIHWALITSAKCFISCGWYTHMMSFGLLFLRDGKSW